VLNEKWKDSQQKLFEDGKTKKARRNLHFRRASLFAFSLF
jgi:hypothetical protein